MIVNSFTRLNVLLINNPPLLSPDLKLLSAFWGPSNQLLRVASADSIKGKSAESL